MRGRSHSEGLRNFRELQVCDPVPSRKGLATFPGSKITIKTKIGMNQFCKNCDEALKLHAVTNWYGQSGFTFRADDQESIVTFAAALRTVEGIEDVEVSKDYIRSSMCCILHDSGYKVASDTHILVVLKEDYPEDMEGKLMKKDGTIYKDSKFPNWRMVIPDPKEMGSIPVRLDFAGIREFERDFKAKKKINKTLKGYIKVGTSFFKLDLFIKAIRFMEHVGTDELMLCPDGKRAALAVAGDNRLIVMPVYPRSKGEWEENEVCYDA